MKEVALHDSTSCVFQITRLNIRLDPFRDEVDAKAARNRDNGQNDRRMPMFVLDFLYERLVDLEGVNREAVQIGQ